MSQSITAAQLKSTAGSGARSDLVSAIVRGWPTAVAKAGLTTRLRAAHFLAQIMTETGGLAILEESGAYRAVRISEIFGVGHHSAKVTLAEAKRIAALPVVQRGSVLFNRVYGVGNPTKMREFGNTGANDGWLYRGGGMMQATGKSNYAAMEKKTGLPLVAHPELLHQPDSAFMAAYLEWAQDGRCNAAADRDDVVAVRKIINGGSNGLAECKAYLAKAKRALADYQVVPMGLLAEPDVGDCETTEANAIDDTDAPAEAPDIDVGTALPIDPDVTGDPELFAVQKRLKGRHYSPGIPSGSWGGMTAGAISGFANDAHLAIGQLGSIEEFTAVRDEIKAELAVWESTDRYRPVTEERAAADAKTVAAVAPEAVPVKRNFWAAVWAAIVALASSIWNAISGLVSQAWGFFTDHKDDLPGDTSGIASTVWSYVTAVPVTVWCLAAAGGFAVFAWNQRSAFQQIVKSVQTGDRQ